MPVSCTSCDGSVDVGKSPDIPYVYVNYNGSVQNYKPIQVVTACSLNIYNFPFDVQNCSLTFQSWLHTSKSVSVRTPDAGRSRGTRVDTAKSYRLQQRDRSIGSAVLDLRREAAARSFDVLPLFHPVVKDIDIRLIRSPEEVRVDKSVFMNQGEWELLQVLSNYKSFSVDNNDYYAEMKFNVRTLRVPTHYLFIKRSF